MPTREPKGTTRYNNKDLYGKTDHFSSKFAVPPFIPNPDSHLINMEPGVPLPDVYQPLGGGYRKTELGLMNVSKGFSNVAEEERKKGQYKLAKSHAKQARKVNPFSGAAYIELALLKLDKVQSYVASLQGRYGPVQTVRIKKGIKKAEALAKKAEALQFNDPAVLERLAEFHRRNNNPKKAQELVEKAEILSPAILNEAGEVVRNEAGEVVIQVPVTVRYEKGMANFEAAKSNATRGLLIDATEELEQFLARTEDNPFPPEGTVEQRRHDYRKERANAHYALAVLYKEKTSMLLDTTDLPLLRQRLVSHFKTLQEYSLQIYELNCTNLERYTQLIEFLPTKRLECKALEQRADISERFTKLKEELAKEEQELLKFETTFENCRKNIEELAKIITAKEAEALQYIKKSYEHIDQAVQYDHSVSFNNAIMAMVRTLEYQEQFVTSRATPIDVEDIRNKASEKDLVKLKSLEASDKRLALGMSGMIAGMTAGSGISAVGMGRLLSADPITGMLLFGGGIAIDTVAFAGLAVLAYFDSREREHIARVQQKMLQAVIIEQGTHKVLYSTPDILAHAIVYDKKCSAKERKDLQDIIYTLYQNQHNKCIMDIAAYMALEATDKPLYVEAKPEEAVRFKVVKKYELLNRARAWAYGRYHNAVPFVVQSDMADVKDDLMTLLTSVVLREVRKNQGKPYQEKKTGNKYFYFLSQKDHSEKKAFQEAMKRDIKPAAEAMTLKGQYAVEKYKSAIPYQTRSKDEDMIPLTIEILNAIGGNDELLRKNFPARVEYLEKLTESFERYIGREIIHKPVNENLPKPALQPYQKKDMVTLVTLATSIQRRAEYSIYQKFDKLRHGDKSLEKLVNLLMQRADAKKISVEKIFQTAQAAAQTYEELALKNVPLEKAIDYALTAFCDNCAHVYRNGIKSHWLRKHSHSLSRVGLSDLTAVIDSELDKLSELSQNIEVVIAQAQALAQAKAQAEAQAQAQQAQPQVQPQAQVQPPHDRDSDGRSGASGPNGGNGGSPAPRGPIPSAPQGNGATPPAHAQQPAIPSQATATSPFHTEVRLSVTKVSPVAPHAPLEAVAPVVPAVSSQTVASAAPAATQPAPIPFAPPLPMVAPVQVVRRDSSRGKDLARHPSTFNEAPIAPPSREDENYAEQLRKEEKDRSFQEKGTASPAVQVEASPSVAKEKTPLKTGKKGIMGSIKEWFKSQKHDEYKTKIDKSIETTPAAAAVPPLPAVELVSVQGGFAAREQERRETLPSIRNVIEGAQQQANRGVVRGIQSRAAPLAQNIGQSSEVPNAVGM